MKNRKVDYVLILLIIFIFGWLLISSTKKALSEARETYTKDQIADLKVGLDKLVDAKSNLIVMFPQCNSADSWCYVSDDFVKTNLLSQDEFKAPLFPAGLKDATGSFLRFQATGLGLFTIQGNSTKGDSLCWIETADKEISNVGTDQPSSCL